MAEHSSFFNGPTYDAADFAAFFASFFKNGVFAKPADGLQARSLHNDMRITILPGVAFIDGYRYELDNSDAEFTLTAPTADGTLDRKDIIVIRRDLVNNNAKAYYIAGTPASNPSAPSLTHTSEIDEIQLCSINVAHGAVKISDSDITDTRFNDNLCGIVASAVKDISASELFAQYDSIFNSFKAASSSSFDTWFANVKNTLDGDTAGHLLNEINKKLDKSSLLDLVFPVGATYSSLRSTSPASLFGGTWQQIKDRFILAAGDTYKVGDKGGEATHTLTRAELPNIHLGPDSGNGFIAQSYSDRGEGSVVSGGSPFYYTTRSSTTEALGSGQPHNTMPPYDTFYVWERIF
jgi:hypothetical protein